jgi:hypothetical protein
MMTGNSPMLDQEGIKYFQRDASGLWECYQQIGLLHFTLALRCLYFCCFDLRHFLAIQRSTVSIVKDPVL